jgi:hypothetical protein
MDQLTEDIPCAEFCKRLERPQNNKLDTATGKLRQSMYALCCLKKNGGGEVCLTALHRYLNFSGKKRVKLSG